MFSTYFQLGLQHILDVNGYDHIIFVMALGAVFSYRNWKSIAVLVTAFTIGHSLTLALAVLDIIRFPASIIETLIPITILLTCIYNIFFYKEKKQMLSENYILAVGFGLIHGMGFSNFLRATLMPNETSIVAKLFAFNIGLEVGQLMVVGLMMLLSYLFLNILKQSQRDWTVFVSGIAFGIATILLVG